MFKSMVKFETSYCVKIFKVARDYKTLLKLVKLVKRCGDFKVLLSKLSSSNSISFL